MVKSVTSYKELQELIAQKVKGLGYIGDQLILIEKAGYSPEEYYRQTNLMYAYFFRERQELDQYRHLDSLYMTILQKYETLRMLNQQNEIPGMVQGLTQVDRKQIEEEIIRLSSGLPEELKQEIIGSHTPSAEKQEAVQEEISSIDELNKKIDEEQDKLVALHEEQEQLESAALDEISYKERKEELDRAFAEIGKNLSEYISMKNSFEAVKSASEGIVELQNITPNNDTDTIAIRIKIKSYEEEIERKSKNLTPGLLASLGVKEESQPVVEQSVEEVSPAPAVEDTRNAEVTEEVSVEATSEEPAEEQPIEEPTTAVAVVPQPVVEDTRNAEVTEEVPAEVTSEEPAEEVEKGIEIDKNIKKEPSEEQPAEEPTTAVAEVPAPVVEDTRNAEVTEEVPAEAASEEPAEEVEKEIEIDKNIKKESSEEQPASEESAEEQSVEEAQDNVPEEESLDYADMELERLREELAQAEERLEKSKTRLQEVYSFWKDWRINTVFTTVEELDKFDENYLATMNVLDNQFVACRLDVEKLREKVERLERSQQEMSQEKVKEKVLIKDNNPNEEAVERNAEVQDASQITEQIQEPTTTAVAVVPTPVAEDTRNAEVTEDVPVETTSEEPAEEQSVEQSEPASTVIPEPVDVTRSSEESEDAPVAEDTRSEEPAEEQSVEQSEPASTVIPVPVDVTRSSEESEEVPVKEPAEEQPIEEDSAIDSDDSSSEEPVTTEENDEEEVIDHSEDNGDESSEEVPVEEPAEEQPIEEDSAKDLDDSSSEEPVTAEENDEEEVIEEPIRNRGLQTIIASILIDPETGDPVNITVKQKKRYEKSNISITGALKNGLSYGNYLYNLTSIAPTIIGIIPNALMKLSGKIMLTRKAKHNIKTVKENLENLSDEDLEVLYREFKGDAVVNLRGAAAVTGLIKEAVEKYQERKYIAPKRAEMKVLYETILSDYEQIENNKILIHQITSGTMSTPDAQTLIEKLGVSNLSQAVALLESRNNRLMSLKSYQIGRVRELGKELQPELSSGKHGFAEDIRATDSKMNLRGRRFAKDISTGAAQEIMAEMGKLQDAEAAAVERGDNETALKAFMKLETTQARESKIENSIAGKRDTGLYHYNPIPEELDYRQDPIVRNLLATVTTAAMVKGIIDQLHNRMLEADLRRIEQDRANQQKVIDDVNQRNSEANAHNAEQQYAVQQGSATLTENSENIRRGMQAQIDQDIAATRATHEYMDHDANNWSFNDAYHAADQAHHTTIQNAAQDAQNQLVQIQQNLSAGRISDVEAMRQIALVNSDTHSMFQQAVRDALPVFRQYAQAHPNVEYGEYISSLERLAADPTAIDALNQQAITAVEIGQKLSGVNILPYEQLGIVLEQVPSGIRHQLYLLGATALMTGHAATQAQQFSKESDNEEILGALQAVVENDASRKERHERIDAAVETANTKEEELPEENEEDLLPADDDSLPELSEEDEEDLLPLDDDSLPELPEEDEEDLLPADDDSLPKPPEEDEEYLLPSDDDSLPEPPEENEDDLLPADNDSLPKQEDEEDLSLSEEDREYIRRWHEQGYDISPEELRKSRELGLKLPDPMIFGNEKNNTQNADQEPTRARGRK